jgi:hypothetical protein
MYDGAPGQLGSSRDRLRITAGEYVFEGVLENERAPSTCAWFAARLPFRTRVIHVRWSGEAVWIPLADLESGLLPENHTIYPSRGDVLFYPGGISEAEILIAYGSASFASKAGQLAGNHFITVTTGVDRLADFGNHVLWHGALDIEFTAIG